MHQELHPSCLFSFAGNLIPFPDHNQSPRNVYQCQMGKQTMGTAVHAWHTRADNKMYRLQFPQSPLLKLEAYERYEMDEYPLGTNACVAVISYTGYDMEDAMVINKSSFQRGFAHGTVIKVERINLVTINEKKTLFRMDPKQPTDTVGVQIFFGIVYYQRLRHMIADKFQVRSTGPIDPITHQPVKGRKKGGGIRFGEMERDAIIAHGTAFVLQDRLLNCSDRDVAYACRRCGSLLSVLMNAKSASIRRKVKWTFRLNLDYQ
ncbi:unnamed protein product [Nippostrongylus brasiliensis]|uniref:DNA-directed RNA polymerase n=1 Tax=Nippostrongylus brasiliensis TaxID=27835 RepID=A0A0N4YZC4_NIPBR|nr:unnamed protein product [Nippostrongylus brasiliensis]